jgi:hypothetical protein
LIEAMTFGAPLGGLIDAFRHAASEAAAIGTRALEDGAVAETAYTWGPLYRWLTAQADALDGGGAFDTSGFPQLADGMREPAFAEAIRRIDGEISHFLDAQQQRARASAQKNFAAALQDLDTWGLFVRIQEDIRAVIHPF